MKTLNIIEKDIGEKETRFTAVASTATKDRHGEIVEVEGWDFKDYLKNPVILWSHNHAIPAIGRAVKVWTEGVGEAAKLMFKGLLNGKGEYGSVAKALVDDGTLNSFSVGFKSEDFEDDTFKSQELLEISLVNVPANSDAQIVAYKAMKTAGICDSDMVALGVTPAIVQMQQRLDILDGRVETLVKGLESLNPKQGLKQDVIENRLALSKVVARATDKMLEAKSKDGAPEMAKVIKKANEKLTISIRKDLTHGTN